MDISGKKALVTGGGTGYGLGIALALKGAGANVWITGRREEPLKAAAEKYGLDYAVQDITKGSDWDGVLEKTGSLDILVNNAGGGGHIAPVSEQSDDEIASVIASNLTGAIIGCRRVGRMMAEKGFGTIVNISSVCALYAWPGWSVYTAAKAGLAKFSHGLYTELRPHGVRVTCLTPSWGATDFNKAAGISGASEDPSLAPKCTRPEELGDLVLSVIRTPDHLAIPDVTIQPMVQDISPM